MASEKTLMGEILDVDEARNFKGELLDGNETKILKLKKLEKEKKLDGTVKILDIKEAEKRSKRIKRRKIIKNFFRKRKSQKISFTPYIRTEVDVRNIMKDVIIALFPAIIAAWLVYGIRALLVIVVSVLSAVWTEKIFSGVFLNDSESTQNLSAIITGILLALTLAPFTSLPVVAFGASMAIIFGKLMYGRIGKNIFNPAVVGREFMTVFFPVAMSSGAIWFNKEALKMSNIRFFENFSKTPFANYLDSLLLSPSGSLGSYSAFALILGGLYLLLKNRISWHIPVSLFATAFLATMFLKDGISVSIGGVLLIGIFMATDMPTSPMSPAGKVYYGVMLGAVIVLLTMLGIKNETLSYVLLILNPFAKIINKVFRPVVFGYDLKEVIGEQLGKASLLTLGIFVVAASFTTLHKMGAIPYLVYLYILVLTVNLIRNKKI